MDTRQSLSILNSLIKMYFRIEQGLCPSYFFRHVSIRHPTICQDFLGNPSHVLSIHIATRCASFYFLAGRLNGVFWWRLQQPLVTLTEETQYNRSFGNKERINAICPSISRPPNSLSFSMQCCHYQ